LLRSLQAHDTIQQQDFEAQLALAIQLSLQETPTQPNDSDTILALKKQEEEDLMYARSLQYQERLQVGAGLDQASRKRYSDMEYKLYNLQFDDPVNSYDDLEETEFDYTENRGDSEFPLLYDKYQKEIDKQIGHVTRRTPMKRVNAAPASSHLVYPSTRNKGKGRDPAALSLTQGRISRKKKGNIRHNVRIKSNETYDYGYVVSYLGAGRVLVYVWSNNSTKIGRICGKLLPKTFIRLGDVVFLRMRSSVTINSSKVDIIQRLSESEYHNLIDTQILRRNDFTEKLTDDVIRTILSHMDELDIEAMQSVSPKWKKTIERLI
jgi:initiation factor 1A